MQTKNYLALFILLFTFNTFADDGLKFSELRVLLMTNTFGKAPTALNTLTAPDNVDALDSIYGIGLEADARYKWVKFGTRFKAVLMSKNAPNAPANSSAGLTVEQYSAGALVRVPLTEQDHFQFDVLAEIGGANTKIDVETSSAGKGTFSKEAGLFGRAGASVGVGWPTFKIYLEAGQEWNNLNNLKFEGNLANNVSEVDFSGPYYSVGLIFSGIPSWITPGGITFGK